MGYALVQARIDGMDEGIQKLFAENEIWKES
jgi:hypothetical protein